MSDLKKRIEAPRVDWPDQQQVIRDLGAMYRVLDRQGWLQGMLGRPGGPRCLAGALYEATGRWYPGHQEDRTRRIVYALGFYTEKAMGDWQDAPGRTKDEVLLRVQEAKDALSKGKRE